jgi:hypothetical protein
LQTAPGQALQDSSNPERSKSRKSRGRRGVDPMVAIIAAILIILSLAVMGVYLLGVWPPKSAESSLTVAEQWNLSRTATPGTQHINGLKVEKVGTPVHEGDTVTVTLKVTNNVMMPDPKAPTPESGKAAPIVPAFVYNGSIRVLFYNEKDGKQIIIGGGYGNAVNLNYEESKEIEVVCVPVEGYDENTKYEAFPDYVWTDKDPVKATPEAGASPTP